jgi:hypothetical protein
MAVPNSSTMARFILDVSLFGFLGLPYNQIGPLLGRVQKIGRTVSSGKTGNQSAGRSPSELIPLDYAQDDKLGKSE